MKRWTVLTILIALIVGLTTWAGRKVYTNDDPLTLEYQEWPKEVLQSFAEIPVHNGNRIKPYSTYAKVSLVKYHGSRSMRFLNTDGEKVKVGPEAFMLDALFRPDYSKDQPIFKVTNSAILNAIGMETKKASDYYSYNALSDYRENLYNKASGYEELLKKEGTELDITKSMTLDLARNVREYETLLTYFNFARAGIVLPRLPDAPADSEIKRVPTSSFMMTVGEIHRLIQQLDKDGQSMPAHLVPVLDQLLSHINESKFGPIIYAPNSDDQEWLTNGDALMNVFRGNDPEPQKTIATLQQLEKLYQSQQDKAPDFPMELKKTVSLLEGSLNAKQQADFDREVTYNRKSWFFLATWLCFLPGMIFIAISWLSPSSLFGKILSAITWIFTGLGLVLTISGIVQRALIMHRPPVGNLYDTIIFIAAGIVFIALFTELVSRRKLALGAAPYIGFFLLVLANLYELESKADNMEPLIAVLRSNFWLTVHVPVITMGYAAGLAAWLFGVVYVFVRIIGLHQDDPSIRRVLTRMTYGAVCFSLLLSLIGTVTGGIWANDSWGRFWGWDPKENGALMIVLWTLFVLHARLGGIIKEWGLQLTAIITGPIVVFSWWHTNLLGVGLHSYGFSDSKKDAVFLFYTVNACILVAGFITYRLQSRKKSIRDNA